MLGAVSGTLQVLIYLTLSDIRVLSTVSYILQIEIEVHRDGKAGKWPES